MDFERNKTWNCTEVLLICNTIILNKLFYDCKDTYNRTFTIFKYKAKIQFFERAQLGRHVHTKDTCWGASQTLTLYQLRPSRHVHWYAAHLPRGGAPHNRLPSSPTTTQKSEPAEFTFGNPLTLLLKRFFSFRLFFDRTTHNRQWSRWMRLMSDVVLKMLSVPAVARSWDGVST